MMKEQGSYGGGDLAVILAAQELIGRNVRAVVRYIEDFRLER